jgi:tetratricopeptide (TPR) repeat protein
MADEAPKTSPGKRIMGWIGTISALIGFGASIAGGIKWYENRREHQTEVTAQMARADAQRKQGEYAAAVTSYNAILKDNPLDPAALLQQQQTAMEWVENFRAVGDAGQSAAGQQLDQIMAILDAALTRAKGTDAADIQAHIGWAHWLNQKIAQREFGSTTEDNLRAALKLDPSNVYANAMLGNWMLQNGGASVEAIQHFQTAAATGKVRPFVRRFEIGAISPGQDALQPELFKIANEMRSDGEPLDASSRKRMMC